MMENPHLVKEVNLEIDKKVAEILMDGLIRKGLSDKDYQFMSEKYGSAAKFIYVTLEGEKV